MSDNLESSLKGQRIWQQNLNKLDKAQFDLINSSLHKDWDLLLLQEPYIDKFGNTKATSKWHTIYPSSHLSDTLVNRSVILVNTAIDTNTWAQVLFEGSNNIMALRLWLPHGQLTIFNIYNDCTHSNTLSLFRQYLDKTASSSLTASGDRMLWCGDFNHHHLLWDEEHNSHLFMESASLAVQLLMSLLEDYNMVMILPKNILTLQSLAMGNWTRVDNVFTTANTEELVVVCDTDLGLWGPGTDHSHQTKKKAKTAEDVHGRGSSGSTRITSSSTPGGATPQRSPSIVEIDDDEIAKATENSDSECGK